ncbi:MAG: hypothetical protein K2R98_31605, partial [Gemmataceae bacterium]|nr:hypothetical protein [Gemmataceae bacterium]
MKHDGRTDFRRWFEDCLRGLKGKRLEWPQLLRHVLGERLQDTVASDIFYKGEVFIDRDLRPAKDDPSRSSEKLLVRRWYRTIHEQGGLLRLGSEEVWPISWEVPNQGKEKSNAVKSRRVDLLGLRRDGGLVIFECKIGTNKDT